MVTNVTSLLKTVKAVEDEATKGTRALEATTEHIRQELAVSTRPGLQGLQSERDRARLKLYLTCIHRNVNSHTHSPHSSPDFSSELPSGLPLLTFVLSILHLSSFTTILPLPPVTVAYLLHLSVVMSLSLQFLLPLAFGTLVFLLPLTSLL